MLLHVQHVTHTKPPRTLMWTPLWAPCCSAPTPCSDTPKATLTFILSSYLFFRGMHTHPHVSFMNLDHAIGCARVTLLPELWAHRSGRALSGGVWAFGLGSAKVGAMEWGVASRVIGATREERGVIMWSAILLHRSLLGNLINASAVLRTHQLSPSYKLTCFSSSPLPVALPTPGFFVSLSRERQEEHKSFPTPLIEILPSWCESQRV